MSEEYRKVRRALSRNLHRNNSLQSDWNQFGEDCFIFYVLEITDKLEIREKTEIYRALMESYDRGYNTPGDNVNGICFDDSIRRKIAISMKGKRNNPCVGKGNPTQDSASRIKNRVTQKKRFKENKESRLLSLGCRCFVCEQTGKKYLSTEDAAKELGIANNIWKALNGKLRQLCGFTFRYCQPDEEIVELRPTVSKPPRGKNSQKSS